MVFLKIQYEIYVYWINFLKFKNYKFKFSIEILVTFILATEIW